MTQGPQICKRDGVQEAISSSGYRSSSNSDEPKDAHHIHGPLRPGELAEVAVLGDLALALEIVGWFAPTFIAGAFQALAILPFAVLSSRHRLRAGTIAVIGAAVVAGLVGGIGVVLQTAIAGIVGVATGTVQRRGWPAAASIGLTALFGGVPAAALTLVADTISPGFRKLSFAQVRVAWRFVARVLDSAGSSSAASRGTHALNWFIAHWWLTLPLAEVGVLIVIAAVCMQFRHVLSLLTRDAVAPYHGGIAVRSASLPEPMPVPVVLDHVSFCYPHSPREALVDISAELRRNELLAVVGDNGSGKSTLVRLLGGRYGPTRGSIERAGRSGYGEPGGTAMIFQRPESQVLGVRVRDDLWWGLTPDERVEAGPLLEQVGLLGFDDRETSTLSGGQLQRLAVASALARRPRLLISDESTAMVDEAGRQELVDLYARLARQTTVVHVTHRSEEASLATRVVRLDRGGIEVEELESGEPRDKDADSHGTGPSGAFAARRPVESPGRAGIEAPGYRPMLVSLRRVGHIYSAGTPWAQRALRGIDLEILAGEGIVIAGANGSGKTTLAWILGGLLNPAEGEARIGGRLIGDSPERVAVAFQQARLQLLRPRVLADVMTGLRGEPHEIEDRARRALFEVGLDPYVFGPRKVDDLSGGEQRRVALAGLLVRRPELLVLDEPLAGLDAPATSSLLALLRRLREDEGIATVVVSHDLGDVENLGRRLVTIEAGEIVSDEVVAA